MVLMLPDAAMRPEPSSTGDQFSQRSSSHSSSGTRRSAPAEPEEDFRVMPAVLPADEAASESDPLDRLISDAAVCQTPAAELAEALAHRVCRQLAPILCKALAAVADQTSHSVRAEVGKLLQLAGLLATVPRCSSRDSDGSSDSGRTSEGSSNARGEPSLPLTTTSSTSKTEQGKDSTALAVKTMPALPVLSVSSQRKSSKSSKVDSHSSKHDRYDDRVMKKAATSATLEEMAISLAAPVGTPRALKSQQRQLQSLESQITSQLFRASELLPGTSGASSAATAWTGKRSSDASSSSSRFRATATVASGTSSRNSRGVRWKLPSKKEAEDEDEEKRGDSCILFGRSEQVAFNGVVLPSAPPLPTAAPTPLLPSFHLEGSCESVEVAATPGPTSPACEPSGATAAPPAAAALPGTVTETVAADAPDGTDTSDSPTPMKKSSSFGRQISAESCLSDCLLEVDGSSSRRKSRSPQQIEQLRYSHERSLAQTFKDAAALALSEPEMLDEEEEREPLLDWLARWCSSFISISQCVGGVLPWSTDCYAVSLCYQVFVVVLQLLATIVAALHFSDSMFNDQDSLWPFKQNSENECSEPVLISNVLLQLGAVVGLVGVGMLWGSSSYSDCLELLATHAKSHGYCQNWAKACLLRATPLFVLWFGALAERCRHGALHVSMGCPASEVALNLGTFGVASVVVLTLALYMLQICCCLSNMVDNFCCRFVEHPDCADAVKEWNLLQAVLRLACGTVQNTFLILQTTALLTVMCTVADSVRVRGQQWSLAPGLAVVLLIAQVFLAGTSVTDKCVRVPAFINSLSIGKDLDLERMYVVEYMQHSQAGFYIYNVRLDSAMAFRMFYVSVVVAFGFATKVISL